METTTNNAYQKAETRLHILDSAYKCIELYGYDKTSMAQIGREAGLSRTTLYRYYKDLESLALDAVRDESESISYEIAEKLEELETVEEQLVECIVLTVAGFKKYKWIRLATQFELFKEKDFAQEFFSEMITTVTTPIFKRKPGLKNHPVDVTDFLIRMSVTFLYYPGQIGTSGQIGTDSSRLRNYLKHIIVPVFC